MSVRRRVTLRCVEEDLSSDWLDGAQRTGVINLRIVVRNRLSGSASDADVARSLSAVPPLCELGHPLVKHFNEQFAGGGGTLEKISAVSDNLWWKQKTGRWRGAAMVVDSDSGETTAWLAAGGIRAEGDGRDFYTDFAAKSLKGSDGFLPAAEDHELARVDRKISQRDAWILQVHLSTLALLANALRHGAAGPLIIQSPGKKLDVLSVSMEVAVVEEDGDTLREVIVAIKELSFEAAATARSARLAVLGAIQSESSEWQIGLLADDVVSHATLVAPETANIAAFVESEGSLPDEAPIPEVRVGTRAHYAHHTGLTQATVDGDPVEALCGYWFIPMHDHATRDVCEKCADIRDHLPD